MAFLTDDALSAIGFRSVGVDVRISDRAAIYDPGQMDIGDRTRVDDFCVLSGKVSIGRNVHIAVYCNLAGGEAGITMEDFSGLAYGCQVMSQSDDYSGRTLTNPTVPDEFKSETKAPVLIERHSIVGTHSVVLPGVTIGEGTAIGALSLVTKSTEPWSVYFGAPAKRLKARSRDLLDLEARYLDGI